MTPRWGLTFFAILLPWTTGLVSIQALDADGHVLPPSGSILLRRICRSMPRGRPVRQNPYPQVRTRRESGVFA
jgi:hypothetical protein